MTRRFYGGGIHSFESDEYYQRARGARAGMNSFESDDYYQRARGAGRIHMVRDILDTEALDRGSGLGRVFRNVISSVFPTIKNVIKGMINLGKKAVNSKLGQDVTQELKKTATQGALGVVGDIVAGDNVMNATKNQINKAKKRVAKNIPKIIEKNVKKPKMSKTKQKKKKISVLAKKGGKKKKNTKKEKNKSKGKKNKNKKKGSKKNKKKIKKKKCKPDLWPDK